jgi:hypothetical protein
VKSVLSLGRGGKNCMLRLSDLFEDMCNMWPPHVFNLSPTPLLTNLNDAWGGAQVSYEYTVRNRCFQ